MSGGKGDGATQRADFGEFCILCGSDGCPPIPYCLDEKACIKINRGLGELHRGLGELNRGLGELNRGLGELRFPKQGLHCRGSGGLSLGPTPCSVCGAFVAPLQRVPHRERI